MVRRQHSTALLAGLLCRFSLVGARAGLHRDVPAGDQVWGSPAVERRAWQREVVALRKLPQMLRRLRWIERRLGLQPQPGEDPDESES